MLWYVKNCMVKKMVVDANCCHQVQQKHNMFLQTVWHHIHFSRFTRCNWQFGVVNHVIFIFINVITGMIKDFLTNAAKLIIPSVVHGRHQFTRNKAITCFLTLMKCFEQFFIQPMNNITAWNVHYCIVEKHYHFSGRGSSAQYLLSLHYTGKWRGHKIRLLCWL